MARGLRAGSACGIRLEFSGPQTSLRLEMSERKRNRAWCTLALSCLVIGSQAAGADFDQTYALYSRVLTTFVKAERVNYAALRTHREDLDRYLEDVASVRKTKFRPWSEAQQIAFLCNAYNACTLRLIIDHYPVKSIKDIGTVLNGPWDQPVVKIFGETTTLNKLEHEVLRKDYAEPRLHFALVCAAKSCPPLRTEAYVGARLDEQLDDQARRFLATPAKNRVEAAERTVYLSPIFKWYAGDFEHKSGSVLAMLKPYWPESARAELVKGEFKIRYTEYDWSLNDASR